MGGAAKKGPDRRRDGPGHGGRVGSPGRPGGPGIPGKPAKRPKPGRPGTPGRPAGPGGEILFYAWTIDGTEPTSQEDIFAVDTATGAVRRLTDHSSGVPFVSDRDPAWSPDGSRVVFMRGEASGPLRLVLVTAAGAPLGELAVEGTHPVWLDENTVLCSVHRLGPASVYDRADIVAVSVPGGAQTPLSAMAPGEYLGAPAWHPTGGLAATLLREDPVSHAHLGSSIVHVPAAAVQSVLGGGPPLSSASLSTLTPGADWDADPDWSPDGARIAFGTVRSSPGGGPGGSAVLQSEIALVSPGAPGVVEFVTDDRHGSYEDGINDGSPAFSPDGKWLAWVRGHEDDWTQIVVQRLGRPAATRTVILDGKHWFRHGLDW